MPSSRLIVPGRRPLWKPEGPVSLDQAHPLARKLVQFYLLNEGAGTAHSLVHPNDHITLNSGSSWTNTPYGPALHFNGSGTATVSNAFTPAGSSWSVEMVALASSLPSNVFTALFVVGTTDGLYIPNNVTGNTGFDIDSTTGDINSGTLPNLNTYYHAVFTYDGTTGTVYQNAVNVASGAISGFTYGWNLLGGETAGANGLTGHIVWLRVWDGRVLTANEAVTLYRDPFAMVVSATEQLRTFAVLTPPPAVGGGGAATPTVVIGGPRGQWPNSPLRSTQRVPMTRVEHNPDVGIANSDLTYDNAAQFYGNGTQPIHGVPGPNNPANRTLLQPHGAWPNAPFRRTQRPQFAWEPHNTGLDTTTQGTVGVAANDQLTVPLGLTWEFFSIPDGVFNATVWLTVDTLTPADSASPTVTESLTDTLTLSDVAGPAPSPTLTDTLVLTDSTSQSLTQTLPTDTLVLSDSASQSLTQTLPTDSLALSDVAGPTGTPNPTDSLAISDSTSQSVTLAPTDTLVLSDSPTITQTLGLPADSVTLADVAGPTGTPNPVDTLSLLDSTSQGIALSPQDSLTLADSYTITQTQALTDTLGLGDTPTLAPTVSIVEPALTLGDLQSGNPSVGMTDSLLLGDLDTQSPSTGGTDTLTLTDSITAVQGASFFATPDVLVLSDGITFSRTVTLGPDIGDPVLSDSLSLAPMVSPAADTLVVGDSVSLASALTLVDVLTSVDVLSLLVTLTMADVLVLSDSITFSQGTVPLQTITLAIRTRSGGLGVTTRSGKRAATTRSGSASGAGVTTNSGKRSARTRSGTLAVTTT